MSETELCHELEVLNRERNRLRDDLDVARGQAEHMDAELRGLRALLRAAELRNTDQDRVIHTLATRVGYDFAEGKR
ncbi:MAG TPA: hypothetical protein VNM48_11675 [Chloroflexota bacterium]|nr:hypothetical protein [Chloroflexota bacterium]